VCRKTLFALPDRQTFVGKEKGRQKVSDLAEIVEYVLRDMEGPEVVIGPLVWNPTPAQSYFIVAVCEQGRGFRCDQLFGKLDDRQSFIFALIQRRPPALVIHDTDDELYMARLCEGLWPGDRITALRKRIEAERKAA
jgi:hypothetical protein